MEERGLTAALLGWLREIVARAMPRQTVRGNGGVQVGKVEGGTVNVITVHHYGDGGMTRAQKHAYGLLRGLPDATQAKVLMFMETEFKTRMVMDLSPGQVLRLRRYLETIHQRMGKSHR